MRLRFIIGAVADFEELGIDVSGCRKSVDGTQALIHQENLSDDAFNGIIEAVTGGKAYVFMSNDNAELHTLLASAAWCVQE